MSEQRLIHHMETWLFRQAQKRWNKTPEETAEIFKQQNLFEYVADCYDYLHLSSYDSALEYIETILKNRGVQVVHGQT